MEFVIMLLFSIGSVFFIFCDHIVTTLSVFMSFCPNWVMWYLFKSEQFCYTCRAQQTYVKHMNINNFWNLTLCNWYQYQNFDVIDINVKILMFNFEKMLLPPTPQKHFFLKIWVLSWIQQSYVLFCLVERVSNDMHFHSYNPVSIYIQGS